MTENFSDDCPANTKLCTKIALDQPMAGLKIAAHNGFANLVECQLAQ